MSAPTPPAKPADGPDGWTCVRGCVFVLGWVAFAVWWFWFR